jgi:hypothetical protein
MLAGFALALAACSSEGDVTVTNPTVPPKDFKSDIIVTLRKIFESNGTVSVSNALVSDPALDKEQRYTACVRYTAHGALPGEIGNAERIAYFYGGRINQLIEVAGDQCARAAYKPFPELNRVCLGKGCSGQDQDKGGGFSFGNLFGL